MLEGLRKPSELIVNVVTLLAYGYPLQAIVHAYSLDKRMVASWRDLASKYCEQVHHTLVEQETLDLVHVQADEIRVKVYISSHKGEQLYKYIQIHRCPPFAEVCLF